MTFNFSFNTSQKGAQNFVIFGSVVFIILIINLPKTVSLGQKRNLLLQDYSRAVQGTVSIPAIQEVGHSINNEICQKSFWQEVEPNCNLDSEYESKYRVMYGESTIVDRWPYLVSLQRRLTTPFRGCYLHRCGATLIAPGVLLTAAHCIWSPNHDYRHPSIPNILGVEMYAALAPQCRHQKGITRIKVSRYYLADDYSPELESRGGGDIALLQLEQPVNNKTVVFANIRGAANIPLEMQPLTVVGWGDTEADDAAYTVRQLRVGTLQHVSASVCEAIMQAVSDGKLTIQSDKEICAYDMAVDSCDGDSGGPLLMMGDKDDGTEDVQIGIVSWGPPGACGQTKRQLVGVYTRVSHYLSWIDETIQKMQAVTNIPKESEPANSKCQTSVNGCQCPNIWTFNGPRNLSGCANPDGDMKGSWCIITPDSCPPGLKPAGDLTMNGDPTGAQYDYCSQECSGDAADIEISQQIAQKENQNLCARTIASCECKSSWEVVASGQIYSGCANPDNDQRGTWCHYLQETCVDEPAGRGWDYCKPGCEDAQIKSSKRDSEYLSKDLFSIYEENIDSSQGCLCLNIPNVDKYPNSTCADYWKMGLCETYQEEGYCECTCNTCQILNQGD